MEKEDNMIKWLIRMMKKYKVKVKFTGKTPSGKKVKGVKIEGKF